MMMSLDICQVIKLLNDFVKTIQILERNNTTNHTNNTTIRHDQQDKRIRATTNYFKPWTITETNQNPPNDRVTNCQSCC